MGLFDEVNFDDPKTVGLLTAAANMLQASGPSTTPRGFGQILGSGLSGGMQAYGVAKRNFLDQQKEQAQMDLLKQQAATADRKNRMAADWMSKLADMDNAPYQALADGAKNGSIGPTNANASRLYEAQQNNPMFGIPREAIAADIATNEGKNIGEWIVKHGAPDMQVSNGYAYNKNALRPGFLPQLSMSESGQTSMVTIGPDGNPTVSSPQGALSTYTDYINATEGAKARYGTTTIPFKGGPRMVSNIDLPSILNNGQTPTDESKQTWEQINSTNKNGQAKRNKEQMAILQEEYRLETDPANKAALAREIMRSGGKTNTSPGVELQDPIQEGVKADIAKQRLSAVEKEAQSQQDILGKLQIAESLIKNGAYGNKITDRIGLAAHNLGLQNTQEGINSNLLSQIGNQLVLARGSLGSGVSVADADRYEKAAGDFTRAQSNEQRAAAIKIMRDVADMAFKNANKVRQDYANTGNTPDYAAPQPKTYKDFGYASQNQAIQDARNALLRNPSAKAEIIRRLEAAGINNHGLK